MVDLYLVRDAILQVYKPGDMFVSGGCPRGGDKFGELVAEELKAPIALHRADWKAHGRSAGFRRNGLIARDADVLVACVAPDRTGGTEDTIKKYLATGKTRLVLV